MNFGKRNSIAFVVSQPGGSCYLHELPYRGCWTKHVRRKPWRAAMAAMGRHAIVGLFDLELADHELRSTQKWWH